MTKKEFETFIYIGVDKILICVFSEMDSKILYQKESKFIELNHYRDENKIINFLSENIFKIEKQLNQFIYDINLIIVSNQFQLINLSTKQNIYGEVKKKNQLNLLKDLENYILDSYPDYLLVHYLINHYLFDNSIQKNFDTLKKCNSFCIDTTFILFNNKDTLFYKKIFWKFQISVKNIICGEYIFKTFDSNKFNECEMALKILSGFNPNEVFFTQKIEEQKGFFVRFFNFFN